jgi:hypothetical protein
LERIEACGTKCVDQRQVVVLSEWVN